MIGSSSNRQELRSSGGIRQLGSSGLVDGGTQNPDQTTSQAHTLKKSPAEVKKTSHHSRSVTSIKKPCLRRNISDAQDSELNPNHLRPPILPEEKEKRSNPVATKLVEIQAVQPKSHLHLDIQSKLRRSCVRPNPSVDKASNQKKDKTSVNAIKASKISIRRSTKEDSPSQKPQSLHSKPLINIEIPVDQTLQSTKNMSPERSSLMKSIVLPSLDNFRLDNSGEWEEEISRVKDTEVPFTYRSILSEGEHPILQNLFSETSFKFKVTHSILEMNPPAYLRENKEQIQPEEEVIQVEGRTITFAQKEMDQDENKDLEAPESTLSNPFRRISNLEGIFQRGGFIGAGRVSSVYRVEERVTKHILVLKEIFKSIHHEQLSNTLKKSVSTHMNLRPHPNVISLFGVFEDSSRIYFVEELAENSLRQLTRNTKDKPPKERVTRMIHDILKGVEHLHSNNIAHGRLTPENVLVTEGVCKLGEIGWMGDILDFLGHGQNRDYCSPEKTNNLEKCKMKSDLWSMGVIFHELLLGELPSYNFLNEPILKEFNQCTSLLSRSEAFLLKGLLHIDPDKRLRVSQALQLIPPASPPFLPDTQCLM